ncbi:hypothetical protein BpHYR1_001043 [Brachionus plicatilis]|uniref:Uncharacterized protein n=1 Tax=Brachionus plicatilis TaxID=10195 RepID=A0A3M7QD87_BRAPC|nr:hypothetical protein BpHYR1_001043 [Brachionus plicatilis]
MLQTDGGDLMKKKNLEGLMKKNLSGILGWVSERGERSGAGVAGSGGGDGHVLMIEPMLLWSELESDSMPLSISSSLALTLN